MRFDEYENCIVRRTRRDGVWGEEERDENRSGETSNPIVAGRLQRIRRKTIVH